ncbi:hypothetical protein HYPSUDRAFT_78943 [Hypholoma sublateritium FD-334 SS-4]|uniref:Uncharacterized protein n=1 Tax=Hypholoma sublateritium (strain FD-334 SS-4) TaxID=945553 RepID=A0A0D2NQA5_HYPSF|nr:hypothetical protein HYPSUDRAFT_78943 [Hypholoma sublateritium FD-334 SS-4]
MPPSPPQRPAMDSPPAQTETALAALLTRISAPLAATAHAALARFVERQHALAAPPIRAYPADPDPILVLHRHRPLGRRIHRTAHSAQPRLRGHPERRAHHPAARRRRRQKPALITHLLAPGAAPNASGLGAALAPRPGALCVVVSSRTPLMPAASQGALPILKLLFDAPHRADDALVAPDGQTALRLAAAQRHAHVGACLPSRRRGGGMRRVRYANAANIARIQHAARALGAFAKFLVWDIPTFVLWTAPKHLVVLPFVHASKWAWANKHKFPHWAQHQLTRCARAGPALLKWAQHRVRASAAALRRSSKSTALHLRALCTTRLPHAAHTLLTHTLPPHTPSSSPSHLPPLIPTALPALPPLNTPHAPPTSSTPSPTHSPPRSSPAQCTPRARRPTSRGPSLGRLVAAIVRGVGSVAALAVKAVVVYPVQGWGMKLHQ